MQKKNFAECFCLELNNVKMAFLYLAVALITICQFFFIKANIM